MLYSASKFSAKSLFLLSMFFFVMVQVSMAANSGTMKGKVFDRDTKDALTGATVLVKGTSIGASTDLDGEYLIHNVPAGDQTIVVSYIGYVSITVTVNIPEDQTVTKDFFLEAAAVQGKTVVVTAQQQGQIQAINQQLSSDKIASIVSEAKIQELPDFNAAQAISRLPGISITQSSGEAKNVVVRGLAPQYNEVAIGGITLASTGSTAIGATSLGSMLGPGFETNTISQDRSVDLTMVTPYMIKSIEVYKTLTPDMNANAIGGYVNMELREAPSGVHGDALWQSGYTQKSDAYGNYRAVASISNRFFDDNFGLYVLGNAEKYDRSADNMSAEYGSPSDTINTAGIAKGYRTVLVNDVALDRHVETRERYGGNVILDYKLPSGSIKSINMLSRLNSNSDDYRTIYNYDAKALQFTYGTANTNTDLVMNSLEATNDFGFMSIDLEAANNYSRNHNPYSPYYVFSQDNSFGQTAPNTIPESLAVRNQNTKFDSTKAYLSSVNLFSADYHENDQVYKGDFKIPLSVGSAVSGFFKFGGEYTYNYHINTQSTPYIQLKSGSGTNNTDVNTAAVDSILAHYHNLGQTLQLTTGGYFAASDFTSGDPKLYNGFLSNQFGKMLWATDPTVLNWATNFVANDPEFRAISSLGGWNNGPFQNLPNNYKYIERYYASYLMSELDFGSDFMVVGGARFEEDKSLFFAYNMVDSRNPSAQNVYDTTVYPENHYWLPMVQAKYKLADWGDVRYSYTQTLARPDYSELSPHFNIVANTYNTVWAGNPNLKPGKAFNHDLMLTLHSNELGLLSVGAFYKTIDRFTYPIAYNIYDNPKVAPPGFDSTGSFNLPNNNGRPVNGAMLYTYINSPYKAYVKGIEADFQTRLWYLPSPMNGIVLGVNYTLISSSTLYPLDTITNVVDSVVGRRTFSHPVVINSTRGGRLIFQPNDIVNTYLGYDYKGFSARVSFVFQGSSLTGVGARPETDGFSNNYFRIDASARQMLPWAGLQLYLDANNLNSESNISTQQSIGGFTSEQYYGLTADLGVRLTL